MTLEDQWRDTKVACNRITELGGPVYFAVWIPAERGVHRTYFTIKKYSTPLKESLKIVNGEIVNPSNGYHCKFTYHELLRCLKGPNLILGSGRKVHSVHKDGYTHCGYKCRKSRPVHRDADCAHCKRMRKDGVPVNNFNDLHHNLRSTPRKD